MFIFIFYRATVFGSVWFYLWIKTFFAYLWFCTFCSIGAVRCQFTVCFGWLWDSIAFGTDAFKLMVHFELILASNYFQCPITTLGVLSLIWTLFDQHQWPLIFFLMCYVMRLISFKSRLSIETNVSDFCLAYGISVYFHICYFLIFGKKIFNFLILNWFFFCFFKNSNLKIKI